MSTMYRNMDSNKPSRYAHVPDMTVNKAKHPFRYTDDAYFTCLARVLNDADDRYRRRLYRIGVLEQKSRYLALPTELRWRILSMVFDDDKDLLTPRPNQNTRNIAAVCSVMQADLPEAMKLWDKREEQFRSEQGLPRGMFTSYISDLMAPIEMAWGSLPRTFGSGAGTRQRDRKKRAKFEAFLAREPTKKTSRRGRGGRGRKKKGNNEAQLDDAEAQDWGTVWVARESRPTALKLYEAAVAKREKDAAEAKKTAADSKKAATEANQAMGEAMDVEMEKPKAKNFKQKNKGTPLQYVQFRGKHTKFED